MKKVISVYLTNASSILSYGAEPSFSFFSGPHTEEGSSYWKSQGYLWIEDRDIELPEVPTREELTTRTVECLREKMQQVRATAERECGQIEKAIGDMLMLGHSPATVLADTEDDGIPF